MVDENDWMALSNSPDELFSQSDNDPVDAINKYRIALQVAEHAKADPVCILRLCYKIARQHRLAGSIQSAQDYLDRGNSLVSSINPTESHLELAQLKLEALYLYLDQNGPDEYVNRGAQEVISLLNTNLRPLVNRELSALGQAYNIQSIVVREQGELGLFKKLTDQAIDAFGRANDIERQWHSQFNLGTHYLRHGDYSKAIEQWAKCRRDLNDSDHNRLFWVLHNLANTYLAAGYLSDALRTAVACYQNSVHTNWIDELSIYQTLVDIYKEHSVGAARLGWVRTATKYAERAEEASAQGVGLTNRIVTPDDATLVSQFRYQTYWMQAEALIAIDHLTGADTSLRQALAMEHEVVLSPDMQGELRRVYGLKFAKTQLWAQALLSFAEAAFAFDKNRYQGKSVSLNLTKAEVLIAIGDTEAAYKELATAKQGANQLGYQNAKGEISRLQRQLANDDSITRANTFPNYDLAMSHLLTVLESDRERLLGVDILFSRLIENMLTEHRTGLTSPLQEERSKTLGALAQIEQALLPATSDSANLAEGVWLRFQGTPATYTNQASYPAQVTSISRQSGMHESRRENLRGNLSISFSKDELRILCFDIGIDFEEFAESGKSALAMQLILHCERNGLIAILLDKCRAMRPDLVWQN